MRYLVFLALGYALLVVEGAIMLILPLRAFAPDLALLVVIAIALSRRGTAPTHGAFACALGYVADVVSGGPRGLLAFTFVTMSLVGRFFSRRVYVDRWWGRMMAAAACTALSGALTVATHALMVESSTVRSMALVPTHAAVTAAAAPLVVGLCRQVDGWLGIGAPEGLRW